MPSAQPSRVRPRNGVRLIAAGILAAASAAGIAVAVTRDGNTTPADAPNQTVARDLGATRATHRARATDLDSVEVTLSLPPGWGGDRLVPSATEMDGRGACASRCGTSLTSIPIRANGTGTAREEVGPTVDDLAAALEQQPMRDATVSDIEVDGFAGKLVTMSVPDDIDIAADCDRGEFHVWPGHEQSDPGQLDDVYILDVDGTRLVLDVNYFPDLPQADLDELESIGQSLHIVSLAPTTDPGTTG